VCVGEAKNPATGKLSGPAIVVGDRQTGKTIAAYPLPGGKALSAKAKALSANAYGLAYSDTPVLTGNGQAVVCGNSTYSGPGKRLAAVWLAYPLATPAKPRVIGSFREPANITAFYGSITVDWTNPSGTEVISSWEPSGVAIGDTPIPAPAAWQSKLLTISERHHS